MKKFVFFPLWKIEKVERYLESMEQNGYRLEKVRYSHYFYFKKSEPKQMSYFISYNSFRGKSMGSCDYFLLSNHGALPIQTHMCYYTLYSTKKRKEDLLLLRGARMDYIKSKLLEKALTALFVAMLILAPCLAAIITQTSYKEICLFSPLLGFCVYLAVYYLYGYFKQKSKCKKFERDNFNFSNRI